MNTAAITTCAVLLSLACSPGVTERPTPPRAVALVVSKDSVRLGTLKIEPGAFGELTLTDSPDAAALGRLWAEAKARGSLTVDMHLPPEKEGERGAYGSRVFQPSAPDFADGVRYFLSEEGYSVEAAPASAP
jgi:hypothetical protein